MTCNATNLTITELDWNLWLKQFIPYFCTGLFGLLANCFIFWAIDRDLEVRKIFYLIQALAFGDCINSLSFITASTFRFYYIFTGSAKALVTPLLCMTRVYNWFFIIGRQFPTLVTFVISLDRFVGTAFPTFYFTKPIDLYRRRTVVGLAIFMFASFSLAWWAAAVQTVCTENICLLPATLGRHYAAYHYGMAAACGILSAFMYILAISSMAVKSRQLLRRKNSATWRQLERQTNVTKTMAAVVFSSVLLVSVPSIGSMVQQLTRQSPEVVKMGAPYFALMFSVNSCVSIWIYIGTSSTLRTCFYQALRCL